MLSDTLQPTVICIDCRSPKQNQQFLCFHRTLANGVVKVGMSWRGYTRGYVCLCLCLWVYESFHRLYISWVNGRILMTFITVIQYQIHMTVMTLSKVTGSRSRSRNDGRTNLVNSTDRTKTYTDNAFLTVGHEQVTLWRSWVKKSRSQITFFNKTLLDGGLPIDGTLPSKTITYKYKHRTEFYRPKYWKITLQIYKC